MPGPVGVSVPAVGGLTTKVLGSMLPFTSVQLSLRLMGTVWVIPTDTDSFVHTGAVGGAFTVTVLNGTAGTGVVVLHCTGSGSGPQPAGPGTPGVHEKVTAMMPPGPTRAVVELSPRLRPTLPPVGVHVVVGSGAVTDSGVADSSPDVLFAGVGSVIVVVPVTASGPRVWLPWLVFDPRRVTVTSAGMLFTPTDSRFRP